MPIKQFFKMILNTIMFDILLFLSAFLMGKWYLVISVYCVIINLLSTIVIRIRPKKIGLVALQFKGDKFVEILYLVSSFIPIFNIIFSIIRYKNIVCVNDENFIKKYQGKLITPSEAIKEYDIKNNKEPFFYVPDVENQSDIKLEYENITNKKYHDALLLQSINSYLDYIMLNKNLTKNQKQMILIKFRNNIILKNKVDLSKTQIKRLVKNK